jgi:hypothetical protein
MSLLGKLLGRPGFGYIPDAPDRRDMLLGRLGLPTTPPASASLRHFTGPILDQGNTNSCVAHAWASALFIADSVDGLQPQLDSRRFHYFNARAEHGAQGMDAGTYLRTCAKAIVRFGRPPEKAWDFGKPINRQPSWSAYRAGHDRRGPRGYYRIPAGDLDGVRQAIASNKPVVFGIGIPRSFTNPDGPRVICVPRGESIIGGHAMTIVGYDGDQFDVMNSWGARWRAFGFAWLTAEWISEARDLWAVDY